MPEVNEILVGQIAGAKGPRGRLGLLLARANRANSAGRSSGACWGRSSKGDRA
jgi:hypothetical protein